jgi:hypothetical protein
MPVCLDTRRIVRLNDMNGFNRVRKLKSDLSFAPESIVGAADLVFMSRTVTNKVHVSDFRVLGIRRLTRSRLGDSRGDQGNCHLEFGVTSTVGQDLRSPFSFSAEPKEGIAVGEGLVLPTLVQHFNPSDQHSGSNGQPAQAWRVALRERGPAPRLRARVPVLRAHARIFAFGTEKQSRPKPWRGKGSRDDRTRNAEDGGYLSRTPKAKATPR